MPKQKPALKPVEELTYEESLAELEAIVESLEAEQNPLEESMRLFARGRALTERCNALLDSARLTAQILSGEALIDLEEADE